MQSDRPTDKLPHELIGEFIVAVAENREKAARLLAQHPDLLNARWIHAETVLHFLAIEGYAEGVQFLIDRGADVNAINELGDSALIDVASLGNDEIADILLKHGADPNAASDARDNAMHAAAGSGNARLVELLLKAGANARYRTTLGETVFDALVLVQRTEKRDAVLATLAKYGITPDSI